jgi:hypothetical protein
MHLKFIWLLPLLNTLDVTFVGVLPFVIFTLMVLQDSLSLFIFTDSVGSIMVHMFNHVQTFGILGLFYLSLEGQRVLEGTFFHGGKEASEGQL